MTKPDFSGRWRFDPSSCEADTPTPRFHELVIEQDGDRFRFVLVRGAGPDGEVQEYRLVIGEEHPPIPQGPATLHPWLEWKGADLQLSFVVRIEGEEGSWLVRLALGEGGVLLHAHEHFRGFGQDQDAIRTFVRT
ncbi:MAG: hypothetical protein R3F30_01435 [Planctomycetota bacterium]